MQITSFAPRLGRASHRQVRTLLVAVPFMWGLVFIGVGELLPVLSTSEMVTIRYVFIVLAFGVTFLAFAKSRPSIPRSQWRLVLFASFMGVPASQLGIVYAQNYLAPSLAAVLVTLAPAITAILAPIALNEKISRRQALGFFVAFAGAIVVIMVGAGDKAELSVSNVAGASVGLLTPLGWSLYTLSLKRLSGDHNTFGLVGVTLLVGSIFLIPLVPSSVDGVSRMAGGDWAWMIYLAIGGTFVAYLIWYWALKHLSASETSAYLYLVPVAALIWSFLLLDEVPSIGALGGGAVVLGGVALTQTVGGKRVSGTA